MFSNRLLFGLLVALAPSCLLANPQQAEPAGVVTVAAGATLGSQEVTVGSTVYSGDLLKTSDDGHLNVQSGTVQIALGPNTYVRIFHYQSRWIVEVERGAVNYSAKGVNEDLTLFVLDIRLVPKTSIPASGRVNIVSRCDVYVNAVRSTIEVTSGRETKTIEETKSFRVLSEFGVDYRESWQPILADYPEYPRDAEYHKSHAHVACAAGVWQAAKSPVSALGSGHFQEIIGGAVGAITWFAVHEALESAERP